MEILILIACVLVVLPFGAVLGLWLLRCWWRQRGQPQELVAPSAPPPDLDALWFGHLRELEVLCQKHQAQRQ